jgi:hypothetical protein
MQNIPTLLAGLTAATLSFAAPDIAPFPLWSGDPLQKAADTPVLKDVSFRVIKPYEFQTDGYRFLHGVALAFHKGNLYASFGHNKGGENTDS